MFSEMQKKWSVFSRIVHDLYTSYLYLTTNIGLKNPRRARIGPSTTEWIEKHPWAEEGEGGKGQGGDKWPKYGDKVRGY